MCPTAGFVGIQGHVHIRRTLSGPKGGKTNLNLLKSKIRQANSLQWQHLLC